MSETSKNESAETQHKHVGLVAQYIKDLSFENPRAPQSLLGQKERPAINVNVDVKAALLDKEKALYETVLVVSITAKSGEDTLFVSELSYGGLFNIAGLNDSELEQALLIYAPNLLFPFARRVIGDVTRDGGFPPLLLDPLDFSQLFVHRKQQQAAAMDAAPASAQMN